MLSNSTPYLVTGANGFTGSHLVGELTSRGIKVRAMVREPSSASHLEHPLVELVKGDMKDPSTLAEAVAGTAGIFHIAALFRQAGFPDSEYRLINAEGTNHLFEAAIAAGVPRIVHCSTIGVHSTIENPPADESTPYSPADIYQQTKMEGEVIALNHFKKGPVRGVVIRPAMIYGPNDTRTGKLFRMIGKRRFFFVGPGQALTHWIDVRDLAKSFVLAMEHEELNAEVYIISGRTAITLKELTRLVAAEIGVKPPWLHLPVKPMQWLGTAVETVCRPLRIEPPIFRRRVDFFIKNRSFNSAKARRELGFEPTQDLIGEIRDIVAAEKAAGRV
ncbi:MAG: NAD-dependent epimerase/dehydratase family protein [Puniceicoccaceae bacterium]